MQPTALAKVLIFAAICLILAITGCDGSGNGGDNGDGSGPEPQSLGPSIVSIEGQQLFVRKRNQDGALAPAVPFIIRGVVWSPASRETNTSPIDPSNANVRRSEFEKWHDTDIPLMAAMNVNTVRMVIDPGFDSILGSIGQTILDELFSNGIMVIMTVDDGINDIDRVKQAVNFYKDHPAILMWMLGSQWNINRYFGVASSVEDAARRTEQAAALIKILDPNHPVATSYSDIDIDANGLRLTDTQNYVNNIAPGVDVWGLNIFRGSSFGTLFKQWTSVTMKPMFLGEFGTDAFFSTSLAFPPPGHEDEATQADWTLSLWNDLFRNLSANDASKVVLGGTVFAWNDEWWKIQPAGSQETGGFILPGGHPDDFANEEYFGIVTIDRQTRQLYDTLLVAFDPSFEPPPLLQTTFEAVSWGASVPDGGLGFAQFLKNGAVFYSKGGGGGGGRGFNVAAIDPDTGDLVGPVRNFDTWATRSTGTAMNAMIEFVNSPPDGTLLLFAVADEAGLTLDNSCTPRSSPWTEQGFQTLENLGSQQVRNYCFRASWVMITIKGENQETKEMLGDALEASVQVSLPRQ